MTIKYPPKPAPWFARSVKRAWLEPADVARARGSWIKDDRLALVVNCSDRRTRRVVVVESLGRLWFYCEKRHCAGSFDRALTREVKRLFEEKRTEALFGD